SDFDLQRVALPAKSHTRARRAAVSDRVRQRLLDDAICRHVGAGPEWTWSPFDDELHVQSGRADVVEQLLEACETRLWHERVRVSVGAEHPEETPHLLERCSPGALDRRERRVRRRVLREVETFGAGLDDDDAERVRDDVVELAGDPRPLLGDGETRAL